MTDLGRADSRSMPKAPKAPYDELDLGERYFHKLLELARLRRRSPNAQTLALVLWALDRACRGDDVELSQERLQQLHEEYLRDLNQVA